MAQTHSEVYRAFAIDVDVSDTDEEPAKVVRLSIGIKGQARRIPIALDENTCADFETAERAIEEALELARRTIDRLLDSQQG
jgi:hypothetical protein